ncbi:superoxide dismutase [Fe] 3, chloroplastic [Tanacetum coccineum]
MKSTISPHKAKVFEVINDKVSGRSNSFDFFSLSSVEEEEKAISLYLLFALRNPVNVSALIYPLTNERPSGLEWYFSTLSDKVTERSPFWPLHEQKGDGEVQWGEHHRDCTSSTLSDKSQGADEVYLCKEYLVGRVKQGKTKVEVDPQDALHEQKDWMSYSERKGLFSLDLPLTNTSHGLELYFSLRLLQLDLTPLQNDVIEVKMYISTLSLRSGADEGVSVVGILGGISQQGNQIVEVDPHVTTLMPYMSKRTGEVHWGEHHRGYVETLSKYLREEP